MADLSDLAEPVDLSDLAEPTQQPTTVQPVQPVQQPPESGTLYTRFMNVMAKAMAGVQQQQASEIEETSKALGKPLVDVKPRDVLRLNPALALLPEDKAKGVAEGVANLATAASAPGPTLRVGVAAAMAPGVVMPALAAVAGKDVADKMHSAQIASAEGDTQEAAKLYTEAGGETLMATLPALHSALSRAPAPPVIERPPQVELNLNSPPAPGTDTPIPTTSTPQTQGAVRITTSPAASLPERIRGLWGEVANEALPQITTVHRETGELGVRSVTATHVGRATGEVFAENVLRDLNVDPREFGAALVEDNLRSRRADLRASAAEAAADSPQDAQLLNQAADAVGTVIGARNSPFPSEEAWLAYLDRPEVQTAIERHKAMWTEQKDPLFRQANDLDPETPLPSRGERTGARINMRAIPEGESSPTAIAVHDTPDAMARTGAGEEAEAGVPYRSTLIRQMATLQKRDPFARSFTGLGHAYEADYTELMRHGFGREMPVAAQHEFIRSLVDSGNAVVGDSSYMPDLTIRGERTQNYLLSMRPWSGRYLHLPRSLAPEYEAATGLKPSERFPMLDRVSGIFTKASIQGLAEGTTHMANMLSQVITGPGPTSNPLINALLKSAGRVDLLYTLPRSSSGSLRARRATSST